jgi:hypothetical protein
MDMAKQAGLIGMRPHLDGIYIEALEAFAVLVAEYSYKKGSAEASADFEAIILPAALAKVAAAEREKFCSVLRQLHDSYSLASNSNNIRARGETK